MEENEISRKLEGFKMPKFNLYDGRGDTVDHLRDYCYKTRNVGKEDELLMSHFSESLIGAALEWHDHQDIGNGTRWATWLQIFCNIFSTIKTLSQTIPPYLEWKGNQGRALESLGSDGRSKLLESIP